MWVGSFAQLADLATQAGLHHWKFHFPPFFGVSAEQNYISKQGPILGHLRTIGPPETRRTEEVLWTPSLNTDLW